MIKNSFFKHILFALTVVLLASCDNDFNEVGTDIVGVDNFGFGTPAKFDVTTTNVDLGALESTNLLVNPLGIYNNPVFGLTKANFVTQVALSVENPQIDMTLNPKIDNVELNIPYFNTKVGTETDGTGVYRLDSIYGPSPSEANVMKLSVYENGYYIRTTNPVDQLTQAYYTDQNSTFELAINPIKLNDSTDTKQNDQFFFNRQEFTKKVYTTSNGVITTTTARAAPAMRLHLNTEFFKQKIFNAPAGKLLNNNIFKDYFRGLYFKVDADGSHEGNLAMLNFKAGTITINYREHSSSTDQTNVKKQIVLNLSGNTVSLIEQAARNEAPDTKKLFLKGGANSSMAVIELNKADIKTMKDSKWLINEASLTFTVDQATMKKPTGATGKLVDEPLRVYLYDLTNKRALTDFGIDQTYNATSTKLSKYVFSGILNKEKNASNEYYGRGKTYKIRLTNHIKSLIKLDSTNVKLGLVVTEDINYSAGAVTPAFVPTNKRLKNPTAAAGTNITAVPTMSVIHPLGTVLYGSNIPVGDPDYDKRPKFEIYYTEHK